MALSKDKKKAVIEEVAQLLQDAKMTVVATYKGTPVKAMQELRSTGRNEGTTIKVAKNRLVKQAIAKVDNLKDVDSSSLEGMLLYAFNTDDEVAPAKVIAEFAKKQKTLEFVGAISNDGKLLSAEEVQALAALPSKPELIASVISTLQSPLDETINGLSGNLHGLLDAVAAKA
jgi:large subunit ribosomal protein L10